MKSKDRELYSIVFLGERVITDDLGSCMTACCTNMRSLNKMTGISYDRLVYIFTRRGQSVLVENGSFIIKSNHLYKGEQKGRVNVSRFVGYNRNI